MVANAITAKGVSTSTSASFSAMATNVSNISTGKVVAVASSHTNASGNIMLGNGPVQKIYDSSYLSYSSSTGLFTAKKAFKASISHTMMCCNESNTGYSYVKINSSMASGSSKLSSSNFAKKYQVFTIDIKKNDTIGCFNEQSNSYVVPASMTIMAV